MKNRTYISILILVLALMVITGNSATGTDTGVFLKSVKSGDYAEVKRLIAEGADVNAENKKGSTALMWASGEGHPEVVRLLVDAGADVNAQNNKGYTASMWASYYGQKEVAQLLIEAGADVNVQDNNGKTALDASSYRHPEMIELLKKAGAKEGDES